MMIYAAVRGGMEVYMPYFFTEKLPIDLQARSAYVASVYHPNVKTAEQIHGDIILNVGNEYRYQEGDALITATPGVCVGVKTADCVPILLESSKAVAAIHAGWRGTALKIAAKTIQELDRLFHVKQSEVHAYIGPCVCQACYETDAEVPSALGGEASPYILKKGKKYHPDLRQINALWLMQAGVTEIEISPDCTCCQSDKYWSHRTHGKERGLQLSGIYL